MCLGKVLKKVSYVGLDSLYIKVSSGILEGAIVGVFVGIPVNIQSGVYREVSCGMLMALFYTPLVSIHNDMNVMMLS